MQVLKKIILSQIKIKENSKSVYTSQLEKLYEKKKKIIWIEILLFIC